MKIQVLDKRKLRDVESEVLIVELNYGRGGIVDSSRMSIETDIEHLFQGWLGPLLQPQEGAASGSLARDLSAFHRAQRILGEDQPREYPLPFPFYAATVPGFVLVDVEGGSLRKTARVALLAVVLPIFSTVAGELIAYRILHHAPAVRSAVVVPTEGSLRQFVSSLGAIQSDIDKKPNARETYGTLLSLYSELAMIPDGKITVSVVLKGNVTAEFVLTSEKARHDLPILVERAVKHNAGR
jgi:hypothetical protein